MTFSLQTLLALVGMFAAILALCFEVDKAIGAFSILLASVYLASGHLSQHSRIILCLFAITLCMLPWLGLGHGSFVIPGMDGLAPTMHLPEFLAIILAPVYYVAEFPLMLLGSTGVCELDLIMFYSGGIVIVDRLAVFVVWLGIGLMLGTRVVFGHFSRTMKRRHTHMR